MDLTTYFRLFWVPAVASSVLLALLWARNESSGRAQVGLTAWFLLAVVGQYLGALGSATWIAGFVLQSVLAVGLLLTIRAGDL